MANRPENFVTREMDARRQAYMGTSELTECPDLTAAQVEWLKKHFSPHCYNPNVESIETHLKFAGKSELAHQLIRQWEDRREVTDQSDPEVEAAERATSQP